MRTWWRGIGDRWRVSLALSLFIVVAVFETVAAAQTLLDPGYLLKSPEYIGLYFSGAVLLLLLSIGLSYVKLKLSIKELMASMSLSIREDARKQTKEMLDPALAEVTKLTREIQDLQAAISKKEGLLITSAECDAKHTEQDYQFQKAINTLTLKVEEWLERLVRLETEHRISMADRSCVNKH